MTVSGCLLSSCLLVAAESVKPVVASVVFFSNSDTRMINVCVCVCAAVLSDYDSADPEENGSHSEVKHLSWLKLVELACHPSEHQCSEYIL